jgi:hypothetical protein
MQPLIETTLIDLYNNIKTAFPKTQKREYATDTVVIENITWVPFLGMKTLFLKGLARSDDKKYDCIILFKKINYKDSLGKNIIKVKMSNGKEYFIEKMKIDKNDVLIRCNCLDFYYRFNYYNHLDKSLYGRKRTPYYGKNLWKANEKELPGFCKHIIKFANILQKTNIFY